MPPGETATTTTAEQEPQRRIASFAVIDLETSNLPAHNFYKVSMIELCVYGFAAAELEGVELEPKTQEQERNLLAPKSLPATPRVLHKLKLMLNPRRLIEPSSESVTGLNNFMLEHETPFDANAATSLLCFLKHLQQPVCLVAHNGYRFDFPILKEALEGVKMHFPPETLCLDSLRAFMDIDDMLLEEPSVSVSTSALKSKEGNEPVQELILNSAEPLKEINEGKSLEEEAKSPVDYRALNETTPKRSTTGVIAAKEKRQCHLSSDRPSSSLKVRRSLFSMKAKKFKPRKFPPKDVYRLGYMYDRIFLQSPKEVHFAEADVDSLMKIMQHYGTDFAAYAEEKAIPFAEVRNLRNA